MAEYVQWDTVSTSGGGEMSDYLRLESGNTYRIRPVFSPVKFYKYFHKKDGKLRTAICADPKTCPVKAKYGEELKKPSLRFAAYVIDRADGKVKILEAPQSVFRPIGSRLEMTGKNPGGGKDGSDWAVKVTGKGLNTTYEVTFIDETPLKEEEVALIKEAMDGDKEKLVKLYKVDTPEELEKKLFGNLDDNSGDQAAASAPAPAPAPTAEPTAAPATAGDDFDQAW